MAGMAIWFGYRVPLVLADQPVPRARQAYPLEIGQNVNRLWNALSLELHLSDTGFSDDIPSKVRENGGPNRGRPDSQEWPAS